MAPSIISPELLEYMRTHPELPEHVWYFVAATTLTAINLPGEIPIVYKHALECGPRQDSNRDYDEELKITRRMREALLKTSAVGGVPKVTDTGRSSRFDLTYTEH